MTAQPRIKRLGLVVELEDGQKTFIMSDHPAGYVEIETRTTFDECWLGPQSLARASISSTETDIRIIGLQEYTIVTNGAETTKQLDSMSTAAN